MSQPKVGRGPGQTDSSLREESLWRTSPSGSTGVPGAASHNGDLSAHRPWRLSRRLLFKQGGWKLFLVVVLLSGIGVSSVCASAWYGYVNSQRRQAVAASLASVKSILGSSLERDNDLLATVDALVATHPHLTNASLATVLARLDLSQQYPGSMAFAYIESVTRSALPGFEALARRDPPLGLSSSGTVAASYHGSPDYCLTRLATLENLPDAAIFKVLILSWAGPFFSAHYNYCASAFAQSLADSARTGLSSASSVVALLRENRAVVAPPGELHAVVEQLPIFIEISPVYSGTAVPRDAVARTKALSGWMMGVFDASEILSPALANESGVSLALGYTSPGASPTVLARAGRLQPGASVKVLTFPADPGWTIDAAVDPRGEGPSPALQGLAVLAGGLLVTLLLAFLLSLLIRSRRSALELVEERTAELRHQALHDSLTGLPNRFLVNQKAHELVSAPGAAGWRSRCSSSTSTTSRR